MFYSIQHLTKFHYASPVSESVMEARMHPRSEGNQRCLAYHQAVTGLVLVLSGAPGDAAGHGA